MAEAKREERIYYIKIYGAEGEYVLANECYKKKLLDVIGALKSEKCFEVYGYCVMDDHIHILMNTKGHLLSALVKKIIKNYQKCYRKASGVKCQVLSRMYEKELICEPEQLLGWCRYIHQVPVQYGLVQEMEQYHWSSYHRYHHKDIVSILSTDYILKYFGTATHGAVTEFIQFHQENGMQMCLKAGEPAWIS